MEWFYKLDDPLWQTLVGSFMIFIVVVALTRAIGLRSFAKFTAYDFAFTVAIGSIISSTLTSKTSIVYGSVAIGSLLFLTFLFSTFQRKFPALSSLISNRPLLLMRGNEILYENLKHARVEKTQLLAKLREANVLNFNQVFAVVMESTGDISVLHKSTENSDEQLNEMLLEGVREKP